MGARNTQMLIQFLHYSQKGRQIPSQRLGKDCWCLSYLQYVESWAMALELHNTREYTVPRQIQ